MKHKYNTSKPFPNSFEYWSFAFYGWLLLEHNNGSLIEVEANYATNNQIRIERIINGKFSGNYNDYTVIGYKIRKDKLYKNRPPSISQYLTNKERISFGLTGQLKIEF